MFLLRQGFSRQQATRIGRLCWRFLSLMWRDFWAYGCQKSAAALTYMTLFAIVPLMTVFYAMFSLVPDFSGVGEQLRELIFTHLIPETGQEVQNYLQDFASQARSLTGFGVGMLVVTAYLMLTNIEKTFNAIWGVQKSRQGLSSFLLYWAVLSLGPLLIGAGLAMNTYMLSLKLFFNEFDSFGVSTLVFRAVPFVLLVSAFTLLFAAVPNCRVPLRYAIIGGVVTSMLFELIQDIFTLAVANSSFQLIYGAFAVVPLFLLWVNLIWTIVLAGAIFVRTLAEGGYLIREGKMTDMVASLKCLALFYRRQQEGESLSDGDGHRLGLGVVHWQLLRNRLEKARWITSTASGRYVLTRDLDKVSLWDLAKVLDVGVNDLEAVVARPPPDAWFAEYLRRRAAVVSHAREILGVSIESLLLGRQQTEKPLSGDAEEEENTSRLEAAINR